MFGDVWQSEEADPHEGTAVKCWHQQLEGRSGGGWVGGWGGWIELVEG